MKYRPPLALALGTLFLVIGLGITGLLISLRVVDPNNLAERSTLLSTINGAIGLSLLLAGILWIRGAWPGWLITFILLLVFVGVQGVASVLGFLEAQSERNSLTTLQQLQPVFASLTKILIALIFLIPHFFLPIREFFEHGDSLRKRVVLGVLTAICVVAALAIKGTPIPSSHKGIGAPPELLPGISI